MELTERERRILADIENQFPATKSRRPARSGIRPQWTVIPSAVLGVLLFAAGVMLGVGTALLAGTALLGWWLYPLTPKLRPVWNVLTGTESPRRGTS